MKNLSLILVLSILASCSSAVRVAKKPSESHARPHHKKVHTADSKGHPVTNVDTKRTIPTGRTGQIINREGYALQYNQECKIAHWVSYKIESKNLIKNVSRKNDFAEDELIRTKQATLSDYKHSGYDRGHMARAELFTKSAKLMSDSFRLSNMVPQDPYMNQSGAWRRSEDFEYNNASATGTLFVVSGPILSAKPKTIGVNKVCVPESVFKVIFNPQTKEGIGFIIPNHKEKNSFKYYIKSIDEVELASGLDFFHELDDSIEIRVEKKANISKWVHSSKPTKKYVSKSKRSSISTEGPPVKRSHRGNKCHARGSRFYNQTKQFDSFETMDKCMKAALN